MTLALIDPIAPAEEPACRSGSARRPSELLSRDGAHDVVVPIPDGFELDFGGTLNQPLGGQTEEVGHHDANQR